jgi:hypothetical protein
LTLSDQCNDWQLDKNGNSRIECWCFLEAKGKDIKCHCPPVRLARCPCGKEIAVDEERYHFSQYKVTEFWQVKIEYWCHYECRRALAKKFFQHIVMPLRD